MQGEERADSGMNFDAKSLKDRFCVARNWTRWCSLNAPELEVAIYNIQHQIKTKTQRQIHKHENYTFMNNGKRKKIPTPSQMSEMVPITIHHTLFWL